MLISVRLHSFEQHTLRGVRCKHPTASLHWGSQYC
jgi:hypothetical protein